MNKTLLLILCDFLLLTLLALTRWEDAKPAQPSKQPAAAAAPADNAATPQQDLVAVMRLSLEDEEARRTELVQNLARAEAARIEGEEARARIAAELTRAERSAEELDRTLSTTRAAAEIERVRNDQLARDLAAKEAEARLRAAELTRVAAAEQQARARVEELAVSVGVARREKELLQDKAIALQAEVEAERAERQRVQQTTTELAVGVGQMAEQTVALTKELREARPINANTLFQDYLKRRVRVKLDAARTTFFSPVTRSDELNTVLASDGKEVVVLIHADDIAIDFRSPAQPDWQRFTLRLSRGDAALSLARLDFASLDPRVLLGPLSAQEVARLGGEPYLLALDPFRFPEAVLISAGGSGYGELSFKLDPKFPGYVKLDNRLFRRITGDFSPSRGDLVLSKTGELLGLMVSTDTCALINNFLPQVALPLGENLTATPTGPILEAAARRYQQMPWGLK